MRPSDSTLAEQGPLRSDAPGGVRPDLFVVRHRWQVLAVTLALLAVAGMVGGDVASRLSAGGFDDPQAESSRAADLLADRFKGGVPNLVVVVDATDLAASPAVAANAEPTAATGDDRSGPGTMPGSALVDHPEVAAAAQRLVTALAAEEGVAEVVSYWTLGNVPPLRSTDGTQALVLARIEGDGNASQHTGARLHASYDGTFDGLGVDVGGQAVTFTTITETVEEDLFTAEMIALPITLVLLVLVFGSVVAGLLPLAIGGFAILGTFLVLRVVTGFAEVSIFALNFTTAIGLGLAIDYALLVVSRYREELALGFEVPEAIRRTVATAGRTVIVSAATVASSLAALLVFRIAFLRSFAYAGIAVVALAAIGAVVLLPALLAVVGRNVDRLRVRRVRTLTEGEGVWHRIATTVMRRPIPVATTVIALLVFVGAPFLGIQLGFPDDRVLQPGSEARTVGDTLREAFDTSESGALTVVADRVDVTDPVVADGLDGYARTVSALAGVARVDAATGTYLAGTRVAPPTPLAQRLVAADATYLSVIPSVEPVSPDGEVLVAEVRALDAPFEVLVGGASAELVDGKAGLVDRLPLALALIAAITFVVLFLQFGSILVPVKAIVLNLLSLSATFGAMVWVFQDGHLAGLLGFTPTGTIVTTMPVLMFCIAFGLSMDYEVFLLSRIKEEHDRGRDNAGAVAMGLEKTGRIVTAAALLIGVVFIAFAVSRVSFMQLFGIGMALAVLVDAFLVRATLVPAFMRLAGGANWWAPAPLRRLHERFGISEHVRLDPPSAATTPDVVPTPV
ncbi:MMPL family transporter [Egicoccus sp. AB-alg6-2]|uniref:MMPL family transporter n=1 Tax=Egicoccus sp. AB-alg6-2 TaxID=3242692 RepID=UPI00359E5002